MADPLFVGLMSGTSVDGIDVALVALPHKAPPRLVAAHCEQVSAQFRERILAISLPGNDEIDRLGELDVEIGRHFAKATLNLLGHAGVSPGLVTAIGSHGQTIRHRPAAKIPFTLQVGDPNTIAELTGITTVADFRRRDMAAGGQGAPLVPAFHDAVFRAPNEDRLVANIGGMANVTIIPAAGDNKQVSGFDTGPGNVLLDAWHGRHRGAPVDRDGAWGRQGTVDPLLLQSLLDDPYFAEAPPKSTGRERFSIDWLDEHIRRSGRDIAAVDVQATLVELTARSIANAAHRWGMPSGSIYLCGGGTHNLYLRERLAAAMPQRVVASTAVLGVDPDWVEAMAFAWLAQRTLDGLAGNLPAVTGAKHPVILGGIYPGRSAAKR